MKVALLDGKHTGPITCLQFNPKFMTFASACSNMVRNTIRTFTHVQKLTAINHLQAWIHLLKNENDHGICRKQIYVLTTCDMKYTFMFLEKQSAIQASLFQFHTFPYSADIKTRFFMVHVW